jgi:hypothetical protein
MGIEENAAVARRVFEHLARRDPAAAAENFQPKAEFDFMRSRGPNEFFQSREDALRAVGQPADAAR